MEASEKYSLWRASIRSANSDRTRSSMESSASRASSSSVRKVERNSSGFDFPLATSKAWSMSSRRSSRENRSHAASRDFPKAGEDAWDSIDSVSSRSL